MEWNAQKYGQSCGGVTEHGKGLVEELRELKPTKVLDLGCGTGVLTSAIAAFAPGVIGIDASPGMIEKAKADYPALDLRVMDACALEWEDTFDAVFSNAVFHFIQDQDKLLQSIRRALRPGGRLVCEFGADGNIARMLAAVAAACEKRGKAFSSRFYYPGDDEYREKLEANGFVVESLRSYDLDTPLKSECQGLRGWARQVFGVELGWFEPAEQEEILRELEAALEPYDWDGERWHMANRRLRVVAMAPSR